MARPTEFDRQLAVDAALRLFWCQGYTATSLSQLLEAMNIGRSSFYAAFSDKRTLFIECLDLFYQRTRRILESAMERQHSPRAISEFFEQTLLTVPERRARRGCLMVNSVLELAEVDAELNRVASDHLSCIEALFRSCFEAAQRRGEFPDDLRPGELAASLMVINQGLRVASRRGLSRTELKRTMDSALAAVGLAAA